MYTAYHDLDSAPDSALLTLAEVSAIMRRSRVSLYRDHRAGRLPFIKIASSTRVRVGDLRRLIGATKVAA